MDYWEVYYMTSMTTLEDGESMSVTLDWFYT